MGESDACTDAIDDSTVVAPTDADIAAIEAAGESESDRKGIDEQIADEMISTARFVVSLGVFAISVLLVGAGLLRLVTDVADVGLSQTGEYGVLVLAVLLAIYVTVKLRNVSRLLWTLHRS